MITVVVVVLLIGGLVALIASAAISDRIARRRGSRPRSSSDMIRAERDLKRNLRALRETGTNPQGTDWDKPDERRFGH